MVASGIVAQSVSGPVLRSDGEVDMPGQDLRFSLQLGRNAAVVAFERFVPHEALLVESVDIEVILSKSLDTEKGFSGLKHQRGSLRRLVARIDLMKLLQTLVDDFGAMPPGLRLLDVELDPSSDSGQEDGGADSRGEGTGKETDRQAVVQGTLAGTVVSGGGDVPFTLSWQLTEAQGAARFELLGSSIYGLASMPPWAVGETVLQTLVSTLMRLAPPSTVRREEGADALVLDPVVWILWETLVARGWRLPDVASIESSLTWMEGGIELEAASRLQRGSDRERASSGASVDLPGPQRIFLLGERLLEDGRFEDAWHYYVDALDRHANDPYLWRRVLDLAVYVDDPMADQLLDRALEQWPHRCWVIAVRARRFEKLGRIEEAASTYAALARRAKEQRRLLVAKAAVKAASRLSRQGDPRRGAEILEWALSNGLRDPSIQKELAGVYEVLGRWRDLATLMHEGLAQATASARIQAHLALGRIYLERLADPLRGRSEFERALRIDPRSSKAWYGLVEAFLASGNTDKAANALGRLRSLKEENSEEGWSEACELLEARVLSAAGKQADALELLESRLDQAGSSWLRETADLAEGLERWDLAARALEHLCLSASRADGDIADIECLLRLGSVALNHLEDLGLAQAAVDAALDAEPGNPDAVGLAVRLAEARGRDRELVDLLGRLADLVPERAVALDVRRARIMADKLGRVEESVGLLRRLLDKDNAIVSNDDVLRALVLDTLAEILRQAGRDDDLISVYSDRIAILERGEYPPHQSAGIYRKFADILLARGPETDALARRCLVRAAALAPEDLDVQMKLARFLEDRQAYAELEPVLSRLVQAARGAARFDVLGWALWAQARLFMRWDRQEEAVPLVEEALRLLPSEQSLGRFSSEVFLRAGKQEQARQVLEDLWSNPACDHRGEVALALAELLWSSGDRERAVMFYEAAVEEEVTGRARAESLRRICDWRVDVEDWSGAVKAYLDLAADDSAGLTEQDRAEVLFLAARISERDLSDRDHALRLCRMALDSDPDHRGAQNMLEAIFSEDGRWEDVIAVLERKVASAQGRPHEQAGLLVRLAKVELDELGRIEAARRDYERALKAEPDFVPALDFLAADARRVGDLDRSLSLYGRLTELSVSGDADGELGRKARRAVAEISLLKGDFEAAESAYRQALEWDPANEDLLQGLAKVLTELDRPGELVSVLRRLAEISRGRKSRRWRLEMADLLVHRLKEFAAAAEEYRTLLRQDPQDKDALIGLEAVLARQDRQVERIKVLDRLAKLLSQKTEDEENLAGVLRKLAEAGLAQGRLDVASRAIDRLLELGGPQEEDGRLLLTLAEAAQDESMRDRAYEILVARSAPAERGHWILLRARHLFDVMEDVDSALEVLEDEAAKGRQCDFLRAECLRARGRWEEAFDIYESLVSGESSSSEETSDADVEEIDSIVLSRLFEIALDKIDRLDAAKRYGTILLEREPDDLDLLDRLADLARRQGDWINMRRLLERRLRGLHEIGDGASEHDVCLDLASLWKRAGPGGLERAERLCLRALQIVPRSIDALRGLAEVRAARGALGLARETIEALLEVGATTLSAEELGGYRLEAARLAVQSDSGLDAGMEHFRAAVRLLDGPSRIRAADEWLSLAESKGRWSEVAEAAEMLRDLRSHRGDLDRLAQAYEKLGRLDEAIVLLRDLSNQYPQEGELRIRMRDLMQQAGRYQDLAESLEIEARREENGEFFLEAAAHFFSVPEGRNRAVACMLEAWRLGCLGSADLLDRVFEQKDDAVDEQVSRVLEERQAPPRLGFEAARRRMVRLGGLDRIGFEWMQQSLSLGVEGVWDLLDRSLVDAGWNEERRRLLSARIDGTSGRERVNLVIEAARLDRGTLSQPDRAADLLASELDSGGMQPTDEIMDLLVGSLRESGRIEEAELRAATWAPHSESVAAWYAMAADLSSMRQDRKSQAQWLVAALEADGDDWALIKELVDAASGLDGFSIPAALLQPAVDQAKSEWLETFLEIVQFVQSADERYELYRRFRQRVERVDATFLHRMAGTAVDGGRIEEALDLMAEQYRATSPDRCDERAGISIAMAGILFEQGGDAAAAADMYRRAADEASDFELRRKALVAVIEMSRRADDPGGEEEALRALEEMGLSTEQDILRLLELSAAREAWGETLEYYEAASQKSLLGPKQVPLRATALEGLGRWTDAAEAWLDAARRDPDAGLDHMLRAAVLYRDMCRDAPRAASVMGDVLHRWPDRSDVEDMAEALCTKHGLWDDLVRIERIVLDHTTDPTRRAKLLHSIAVVMDRKLGRPDEAAVLLAQAAAADAGFYPVYRPLGEYHYRRREWAPAEEYLRKALDEPGLDAERKASVLALLARILRAGGRHDEESALLMQAVTLQPSNGELRQEAMDAARRADRPDSVVELLLGAAELSHGPARAERLVRAASLCESQLHDRDRALALYEQVVKIAPERQEIRVRLLELLRDGDDWERLKRRLEAELDLAEQPGAKAAVAAELASIHEGRSGDLREAERYLRMAREFDPLDMRWTWLLTDFLARKKRWPDLVVLLEDLLDAPGMETSQLGGLLSLLGRTYLEKLRETDKALALFERARTLGVLTDRSARLLGEIYRDEGRHEDLVRLLRERLEADIGSEEEAATRKLLAEVLETSLGRKKEAAEELARCFLDGGDFEAGTKARELFREVGADSQALAVARLLVSRSAQQDRALHLQVLGEMLAQQAGGTEEAVLALREALDARWDLAKAHRILGLILFEQGEREQGLVHLEAYFDLKETNDPDDASVHVLVAEAAMQAGEQDKALDHYEKALAGDPTRVDVLEALAGLYRRVERWDGLDGVLARWVVLEPDPRRRAQLWFERAKVQRDSLGDQSEAIRCLKEAVALNPRSIQASQALRELIERQGQFVEAVRLLRKELDAVTQSGEKVRLLLHLGQLLERRLHRPHEAVEAYRRAVATSPRDQESLSNLVRMCSLMGRWAEAASVQEQLASVTGDPNALIRAARLFMRARSTEGAVRCWLNLILHGPKDRLDEFVAGLDASVEGPDELAGTVSSVIAASSSLEKGARRLSLLRTAVRLLTKSGDLERAEPLVAELMEEDPDDLGVFVYRTRLLDQRGDYTALADLLRSRIASGRDEDLAPWLWQLGQLERGELDRPDLAIETFRRLVEESPQDAAAVGVLAELASKLGDYETLYEQYRRLDDWSVGLDASVLVELAEAAEALGKDQEALEYYERVLRDDPDRRDVLEAVARLSLLMGERGRAVEILEHLLEILPLTDMEARMEAGRLLVETSLAEGMPDRAVEHIEQLKTLASDDQSLWRLAAEAYEALGDWERYLDALTRVEAMEPDRRIRARILYRKAQVARDRLGSSRRAADSLLKAADLDVDFPPLWVDLAQHYMREGAWQDLLDVTDTLARFEDVEPHVRLVTVLRRAVALVLLGGDGAAQVPGLLRTVDKNHLDASVVATVLSDAADGLRFRGMSSAPLGRVLDAVGSGFGPDMVERLHQRIEAVLADRPDMLGARRVLLRIAPRVGHRTTLFEHQQMLAFLDPDDPSVRDHYDRLMGADVSAPALDVMGPLVSEDLRLPLRTILVRLSDLLSGFMRSGPARFSGELPIEEATTPIVAAKVAGLVRKLRVRSVDVRVFEDHAPTVHVVDWRPPALLLSNELLKLDEAELFFVLGRSLEWIRSGVAFLENRSDREIDEILVAVGNALGMESPEGIRVRPELVEILMRWGLNPEVVDRRDQDAVVTALAAHWRNPCDYSAYVASQWRMCQRVGLMVSADLSASLRAAARVEAGTEILSPGAMEQRCRLVRESDALRELFRFGVSRLREKLHKVTQMEF